MLAFGSLTVATAKSGQFGTGFAISPKGILVTCHHVVRDAGSVVVHFKGRTIPARVIAVDTANDLALLQVQGWEGRFLGLKTSTSLDYASEVTVAGFPDPTVMGLQPKVSQGIVNALSGVRDDPRYIQVSAPVQPGNSGGPLMSNSGQVVGMITAGLNSKNRLEKSGYVPQTVNYALKSDLIIPMATRAGISLPTFGTRTTGTTRQVQRAVASIALVEGVSHGQRSAIATPARKKAPSLFQSRPSGALSLANVKPQSAGPWVFPNSHVRQITPSEVQKMSRDVLWRARNEIYLRRGFAFTSPMGVQFAREYGHHYRPVTPSVDAIKSQFSLIEINNLKLIASYESRQAG